MHMTTLHTVVDVYPLCPVLAEPPSYTKFLNEYLLSNKPVLIGPKLVSAWPACHDWVLPELSLPHSQINWDHLKNEYGLFEVTVADCSTREFSDQKRQTMLFRDVVELWTTGRGRSLYVKDWHLVRALASRSQDASGHADKRFYSTPDIFRDDWMNAYYSACTTDDFRFVYVGAAGTFTPLHRDVYTSYSWSTNVCGRKRWWLFPPEQTRYLFRKGGEEHAETAFDVRDVDETEFPEFSKARPIVVEQEEGETIFVPSGWYHQVENLTACVSINHNWCNSVNLPSLYHSMCAKVSEVEKALEDVKELLSHPQSQRQESIDRDAAWKQEWVRIVQDVVEKDAGWNWLTFWSMTIHALRTTSGECHDETPLWQPAPPELTPPPNFLKDGVKACYQDFVRREQNESEMIIGLEEILQEVEQHCAVQEHLAASCLIVSPYI